MADQQHQQNQQEAEEKAAKQGARLDLSHGFVRHIKHMQRVRNRVEEEWQRDQQPDKVAERIRARMPTSQELRKRRQRELARNGPSAKLASRAFGAVLGGGQQRQPRASRAKRSAATTTATQPPSQRQKGKGQETSCGLDTTARQAPTDGATTRRGANQASGNATDIATPANGPGPQATAIAREASPRQQQHESPREQKEEQKCAEAQPEPQQQSPPAGQHKPPQQQQQQQQQQSGTGVGRPVFRLEVELDDTCIESIVVREGDELAEVVRDFGLQHDLTDEQIDALAQHLLAEFRKALP